MKRIYRPGLTSAQKTEMWDRYQRGESLTGIGRVFGNPSSSIYGQLSPHGGIRPTPRCRSRLALTLAEREEISRGIVAQRSVRSMAQLQPAICCGDQSNLSLFATTRRCVSAR
jgi:IS30 family transposase